MLDGGLTYDPKIFDVSTLDEAKWVILNPDGVHTPEDRWRVETAYLLDLLAAYLPTRNASCVDFGCGVGRLAKPLIKDRNWTVIGVDISASMRRLAASYVGSSNFLACHPRAFDVLITCGLQVDFAVAVWTLQHCRDAEEDIARILRVLKPSGRLFVLNALQRFLPTRELPWVNDDVDVWAILNREFQIVQGARADTAIVPAPPTLWGVFEKVAVVEI